MIASYLKECLLELVYSELFVLTTVRISSMCKDNANILKSLQFWYNTNVEKNKYNIIDYDTKMHLNGKFLKSKFSVPSTLDLTE